MSTNTTDLLEELAYYVTEIVTESTPVAGNRGVQALLWPLLLVALIITTNGLSLAAFAVEKRLRGYNNYFIINLAISDFLFGFILIIPSIHTYLGHFPLSQNGCKVHYGVFSTVQFVSNLVVVAICVDRHRATYDPIGHFTSRSKKKAVYVNVCLWAVSMVFWFSFSTIPDFIMQFDNRTACLVWHFLNPIGSIVPIFVRFIIPLFVMSILYVRIFIKIRETFGGKQFNKKFEGDIMQSEGDVSDNRTSCTTVSTMSMADGDVEKHFPQGKTTVLESGVQKSPKRESVSEVRSATKTLLFIVISFLVTWLPSSVISLIYAIEPTLITGFPPSLSLLTGWLVFVNPLLNPISYTISQPLFRKTVFGLVCYPVRCRW